MKKSLLIVAAMFAAVTMSARVINIDLSTAVAEMSSESDAVNFSLSDGVLTVNWTASEGWGEQGVAFPLDDLTNVTEISYEYKGDGVSAYAPDGVCLYPRLRDSEGNRWYKNDYWPNLIETNWQSETMLPDHCPWDGATYNFGEQPFAALAFVANPSAPGSGVFYLRNVKITVEGEETAVEQISNAAKATKVIRNGQVLFVRDGKTFNALGAEVK